MNLGLTTMSDWTNGELNLKDFGIAKNLYLFVDCSVVFSLYPFFGTDSFYVKPS